MLRAVLARNESFLAKKITENRKIFIAQPKHMIVFTGVNRNCWAQNFY